MSRCDEAREKMPFRRKGMRVELHYMAGLDEKRFTAEFNFYEDGRLGEVFARPFKTGADLEGLLDKFCIAVSHLLQLGMEITSLWKSLPTRRRRNSATSSPPLSQAVLKPRNS